MLQWMLTTPDPILRRSLEQTLLLGNDVLDETSRETRLEVVDHHHLHLPSRFASLGTHVRKKSETIVLDQERVDLGLVGEDVETSG